jgi:3-oxoadipate enol-lactonase
VPTLNSDLRRRADGTALTRDGMRLAYTLRDAGAGAPRIALVHSLAMDRLFWQPVADLLAAKASVLTWDCRGHGASDKPAGPYTVELFARDLADLLDYVRWPSAAVAGASMGGCVSLAFAGGYPRRTTALGLIDTTAWYGAEAPKQWAERASKAIETGLGSLVDFQVTRWFGDAFRANNPDVVKQSVDVFLRNDVKAYADTCRMLGECDLRPSLSRLHVPTAVIVGEEDYATPIAMAEALKRGIAGSTLTVLLGARHLTPLEEPARIAAELERLLQAQPVQ